MLEDRGGEVMGSLAQEIFERGKKEGLDEGRREGREEGLKLGRQEGLEVGRQQGLEHGVRSMQATILEGLEAKFGKEGLRLKPRIEAITDLDELKRLAIALMKAQTLSDFEKQL